MSTGSGLEMLRGWLPGQVFWNDGPSDGSNNEEPIVEWLHCDEPRFTEPFLDDVFRRCLKQPFNVLFRHRTPLAALEHWADASPGIAPTGFIFHVSRCGSTLLAGLLGSLPDALMLSEPGPVDSIIRANHRHERLTHERQVALLRGMVSALGQRRTPGQDRLFVKFDCWNTRQLPLIRAAFPQTPWVFLYRDPLEVLVSAIRQRAIHTLPGILPPGVFGLDVSAASAPPEEYCAQVLASIYEAGLQFHEPDRSLLVNYTQLPEAAWTTVAEWFGCQPRDEDVAALQERAGWNSKDGQPYESDTDEKQHNAAPGARELAERWIQPIYDRLEARRGLECRF